MKNSTIKQSLKATRTISTKELAVIAHFGNGFAETVYQLSDGTTIFIGYHNDRIRIVEGVLLEDPSVEVPQIVNATEEA